MNGPDDPNRIPLDIVSGGSPGGGSGGRPYLMVYFRCANQYRRVYRNRQGDAYFAQCPLCGKSMRFAVAPGGTSQRSFELSC